MFGLPPEQIAKELALSIDMVTSVIQAFSKQQNIFTDSELVKYNKTKKGEFKEITFNPFPQKGMLVGVERLTIPCERCNSYILKLTYPEGKPVFFCKSCYK